MSWNAQWQRWTLWGVWVASRKRWARDAVLGGILVLGTRAAAAQAAADFQRDFPGERFTHGTIPTMPLVRAARYSPEQVEAFKARFKKPAAAAEEVAA